MATSAPSPSGPETAVYWFARLVKAVEGRDFLLATEAHKKLLRSGWSVVQRPRRAKGGRA